MRVRHPTLLVQALLALLALLAHGAAGAHTRSETQSSWQLRGTQARAELLLPEPELRRLAADGASLPSDADLAAYLSKNVKVRDADGSCTSSGSPRALAVSAGYRRFEAHWTCHGTVLALTWNGWFEQVASHRHFARVDRGEGRVAEYMLDDAHREIRLDEEGSLERASFADFIWHGMAHIFTGPDHQAFLLGLVLLSRRLRDLLFVVTGFTLGHSLTLALAITGVLRPAAALNDALVGVTIALVGAEVAALRSGRPGLLALTVAALLALMAACGTAAALGPPPLLLLGLALFAGCYLMLTPQLADAARLRLVVTLVFGLIHGFTFAANLAALGLPRGRLGELLLGFNLGVELGQLAIVAAILALAWIATRWCALPWRDWASDLGAGTLAGLGLYWFAVRGYA